MLAVNPWIVPMKVEAAAASYEGVVAAILATVSQIAKQ
jgi:hypothetical protein